MTLLEYCETIKKTLNDQNLNESKWNGLSVNFSNAYYAIIKGKIPFELAEKIYNQYPNDKYFIRVMGNDPSTAPIECVKIDSNGNKYIDLYHIDTKEGLVVFLAEMVDYLNYKQQKSRFLFNSKVDNIDGIVRDINVSVLQRINPTLTTAEWMNNSSILRSQYNSLNDLVNRNDFNRNLKIQLDMFDKCVNPFMDESSNISLSPSNLHKVTFSEMNQNNMDVDNCITYSIMDNSTGNQVYYKRNITGISYYLDYNLPNNKHLTVVHNYLIKDCNKDENGEIVYIDLYDNDDYTNATNFRYNLATSLCGKTYKKKTPITASQMKFVYQMISEAVGYASTVTINNLSSSKVKVLKGD